VFNIALGFFCTLLGIAAGLWFSLLFPRWRLHRLAVALGDSIDTYYRNRESRWQAALHAARLISAQHSSGHAEVAEWTAGELERTGAWHRRETGTGWPPGATLPAADPAGNTFPEVATLPRREPPEDRAAWVKRMQALAAGNRDGGTAS
jgi:hypothetical protein